MKKTISLFTAVLLVLSVMPTGAFGAEDTELSKALNTVKEKLSISSELSDFNYSVNTIGDKKIWYFNWNRTKGNEEYISASIDNNGVILSYSHSTPYSYTPVKFPKLSKKDAQAKAEAFLKKINPTVSSQVRLEQSNPTGLMDYAYYFRFTRIVNNIPFDNNAVSIDVNKENGDIMSYYLTWDESLKFPLPQNILTLEQAKEAYNKELGLTLMYSTSYDEKTGSRTFAIYGSKYGANYGIDAVTGKKVNLNSAYPIPLYSTMKDEKMMNARGGEGAGMSLSPQEKAELEKAEKLLTQEQAEKIARENKFIAVPSGYETTNASLSRDWMFRDNYIWDLSFTEKSPSKDTYPKSMYVRVNALNGDIRSFSSYYDIRSEDEGKFTLEQAKAEVEKFLKEFVPQKFAEAEYDETYAPYVSKIGQKVNQINTFRFIRKVNGVPYPDNSIVVTFDGVNSKVTNYDSTWYNLSFASLEKAVPAATALDKFHKEIGIELQYKAKYTPETFDKVSMYPGPNVKPEIMLAYGIKGTKPICFDAFTADMLNYEGTPYKEKTTPAYIDIQGNPAQGQINALAESGIYLEGTEFKPNESITQKDFLLLLSKTMNFYFPAPLTTDKDVENMYNFMIREKVLKPAEKSPASLITREEGVKFIIRALKFDKVADVKGIFNCDFKDADKINSDLLGYVAIAKGLKIVSGNGGMFRPKDNMTRAEAAVVIYNYLQK